MILHKLENLYVWEGGYDTKDIPKEAGFTWSKSNKCWMTKDLDIAAKLIKYANDEAKGILSEHLEEKSARYKLSKAVKLEQDVDIPHPEGRDYRDYQKVGIVYGFNTKRVLIADEMGLGKSIEAIGILNMETKKKNILVVCPATLTINWKREMKDWLVHKYSINVVSPTNKKESAANINIVSYDIIKTCQWIKSKKYDVVIFDECHLLKNPTTKRTKECDAIQKSADRVIMMTGTPILNKPIDLFTQISMLGYNKGWFYFATRYCDGKRGAFGWETKGATNLKELQKVLRENFMIRRLKKFVETQLPEKVRKIIYLDSEKYKSHLILEANALEKFSSNREKAIENIINGASVGELADIRKKLGMAKLPDAIEYINNVLESVHKVVIFARHRDVINKLYQQYSDMAVKVMGGMSDVEKDESVQRFQTDVDVRVFIGAVEAAGVGLTLTAAHKSIFVEFDWTPGKILQCEDRLHRINQKNIVECDYLVVDSSLDAYIIGTMIKKNFVIDTALN